MGCVLNIRGGSELQKKQKEEEKGIQLTKIYQDVQTIHEFRIGAGNMVVEKSGKINIDYTLLNPPLGKGAYGEVRKAIHKATQLVRAVRIINKAHTPKREQERLKHEVDILRNLDHLNIIKVYEFYQDQRFFYIVTELCSGGELFDKIIEEKCFTNEKQAAETMKQILSAVNYCHKEKIMHRDIKPENILYESSKPGALLKLVDFGASIRFNNTELFTKRMGTSYYTAPEVIEKRYDQKCDVWSCGVILYILLCGYPPFNAANDKQILEKVRLGKYSMEGEDWLYISDEAKNLIKNMLEKDVSKRYDAEQALNDEWIRKSCDQQNVDLPTLKISLENMRTFKAGKKLQEVTWMFFVNYLATKEEKNDLLKAFQALDTNGDGKLSKEELVNGFKKFINSAEAEQEVDRIMKIVDKNDSGEIDYTEWVMATINRQNLLTKQRLEMAFKMFDKDGSGTLSLNEIKEMFGGTGTISENVWQEILQEVDDNGDGQISYKEFKMMMMSLSDKALDQKIPDQQENSDNEQNHPKQINL